MNNAVATFHIIKKTSDIESYADYVKGGEMMAIHNKAAETDSGPKCIHPQIGVCVFSSYIDALPFSDLKDKRDDLTPRFLVALNDGEKTAPAKYYADDDVPHWASGFRGPCRLYLNPTFPLTTAELRQIKDAMRALYARTGEILLVKARCAIKQSESRTECLRGLSASLDRFDTAESTLPDLHSLIHGAGSLFESFNM